MKVSDIKEIILKDLSLEKLFVFFDGNYCQIIAIDEIFSDMEVLEAHKMIYAPIVQYISNNQMHAISINVFTPEEWKTKYQLFNLDNELVNDVLLN